MFKKLNEINARPAPFQFYTADDLWTNTHTSQQMLKYHLNENIDISSRNKRFIEQSVNWIVSHFKINNNTEVADFGCGPGLYTTMLAENGAKVTGIDFSENSLKYAKQEAEKKGLKINYLHANYLSVEMTDRFDLIMMIMCDFCALSPEQRSKLLNQFFSFLKPRGSVLLDVYSLNSFRETDEAAYYKKNHLDGFWSPSDYYCFANRFKFEKEKVILDKYTIIDELHTRVVYNWLQYYDKGTLRKEFEENGFKIEAFYSNVAGEPFDPKSTEFAVIAMKSQKTLNSLE